MLGQTIEDPHGVESNEAITPGLRLIPTKTVLEKEKTTVQRQFKFQNTEGLCEGYEIHMGKTTSEVASPLLQDDGQDEGYFLNNNIWGTYMHGIFDNQVVIDHLLDDVSEKEQQSYAEFKEDNYNKLADHLRTHLDIEKIYADLKIHA